MLEVEQPQPIRIDRNVDKSAGRCIENRGPRCLEQQSAATPYREPDQQCVRHRCCRRFDALSGLSPATSKVAGLRPGRCSVAHHLVERRFVQAVPHGFAKSVLHGLSPELVADGRGNHCTGRRTQQGVADEGEKQGQQGTARRVAPPQVPERTEEKQPSIQSVELGQPLKRELAGCCRSLTETVVVRDGICVVLPARLAGDRIQELRQLVEHDRPAGVGAPLAGAEAPERGLARGQSGDPGLEVQVGYCAHGEGR